MAFGREPPKSFGEALRLAEKLLSANISLVERDLVRTEAEQVVQGAYRSATGERIGRTELLLRLRDRYPEAAGELVIVFAIARAQGKLLQHVLGYQAFLDHEYEVGPAVLIPRPETELLVAHAIDELGSRREPPAFGLEIGVGSGAIAIELLSRFPSLEIEASELTDGAERVARANASRILNRGATDANRLVIARARDPLDVWQPFERESPGRKAQFLVSNPPYLDRAAGSAEVSGEVALNEPAAALFAPPDDLLHFYREIARGAARFLEPGAPVMLEVPHERANLIERLFALEGWKARLVKDLNGRDRVLDARL